MKYQTPQIGRLSLRNETASCIPQTNPCDNNGRGIYIGDNISVGPNSSQVGPVYFCAPGNGGTAIFGKFAIHIAAGVHTSHLFQIQ